MAQSSVSDLGREDTGRNPFESADDQAFTLITFGNLTSCGLQVSPSNDGFLFFPSSPSGEKADEQDVCGETETSERKTRCFAMLYNTSGKTSKHPVVFEKAPVLFLKALDLFKKHPCL